MERLLPLLMVRSNRQVYLATLLITAIAVAAPVATFAVVLSFLPRVTAGTYITVLSICAIIPLLIAPPISLFALSILRLLTTTIDRVDGYVRFDSLTGVLSRSYLLGQVRDHITKDGAGIFLMVDADHFKEINDTFGHDVGDETLKRLGDILRSALSVDALVGRLGGEEFGVFLPGATEAEGAAAASELCRAVRAQAKSIAGKEIKLTVSVGGALHRDEQSLERTMKLADSALYHAKRTGRDRFYIADATDTMPALILRASG